MGADDATATWKDLKASGWKIVKGVDKITKNINDVLFNSESDNGYKRNYIKEQIMVMWICLCFCWYRRLE